MPYQTAMGYLMVFGSAFCFYLATVIIKWSKLAGLSIDSSLFTIARFVFGFLTVVTVMILGRQRIKIRKKRYLVGRALGNAMAVYCFFKAVDLTSVAQANILNMTYPLFIALFSWILYQDQRDKWVAFIVLVAFSGVMLILGPGELEFDRNAVWGLGSGLSAGVAIMYLNLSRKVHDTQTTLFVMFTLGGLVVFALFFHEMRMPSMEELYYLFFCSAIAIVGQYLLTTGFKYVTPIEGSIISSTRILLAAILGPFIAMDPSLGPAGWAGAFLIFFGNICLTIKKTRKK
ncbi:MAG: DMT family transporter [Desulfobacterales bacterium]|nr:DMT family transporter [Desulfobacterales bacterium]